MKDRSCPFCKKNLEKVIISQKRLEYSSFQLWGDFGGSNTTILDEESDLIFYNCEEHFQYLTGLRKFKCRTKECQEMLPSLPQLKEHLKKKHLVEFCDLCLNHQHFFIQEYPVYHKKQLKAHCMGRKNNTDSMKNTTSTLSKEFHPSCHFCKKRYYSDVELYQHLERDHFKCHLCNIEHQYYRN
jgi:hypothetical protein